jgi:cell division protein ZapB
MDEDLKLLENKLANLLRLFENLRMENAKLQEDLVEVKRESSILKRNMLAASERIETLMQNLP